MDSFIETQRFRQSWVWVIMIFILLIVLGTLVSAGIWNQPGIGLGLIPLTVVLLLLYFWRLDTRLDSEGIHYRVFPIFQWRTIPWNTIKSASVGPYGSVGYGIRWGFDGWVYNVAGDKGLRITYPNWHQLTIGTQRPDEMQAFLETHRSLITT